MRLFYCDKCGKREYHLVLLTYSGTFEVVTTVSTCCYCIRTYYVSVGTWFEIITGKLKGG